VALFNRGFAARTDDTEWSYTRTSSQATAGLRQTHGAAASRLTSTINHYLVKPFDRRWREAEDLMAGMFWTAHEPGEAALAARRDPRRTPPVSMFERAANVDEFNLIHAAERMARLGANVRVLVVLADGMTRGSVEALGRAVEAVERSGTTVLGIGIGDDTVTQAYHRFEVVNRPDELTSAMIEGTRRALRRGLALWGMDTWWLRPASQIRKEKVDA
jgi:tRNA(Met) C34 N-acetyltransferase TmcA